jgi:DNA-binding NarL/FixJ family response regulator
MLLHPGLLPLGLLPLSQLSPPPGETLLQTQTQTLDPEQDKRRLVVALTQLFTGLTKKQPVLLIIEDIHWSDETSLEFLHSLARRCAQHPFLLVLTYRSDEAHAPLRNWLAQLDREHLAQELVLRPLSRSEVDAMLRAILDRPDPLPAETVDAIYDLTEGNPFFIEEILKSLITAGAFTAGALVPGTPDATDATDAAVPTHESREGQPFDALPMPPIPRSIQGAVQQRLDQLSEAARTVVSLAAVAGRRFDFAILQSITQFDEPELLGLMKELIAAQLVVEETEEQFAFRHALTRQAIYAQLLLRERKALHHKIAKTIEQLFADSPDARLTELGYHFYEAGAWEKALLYARRAGERALTLYSPRAAIEQFTRALKATHQVPGAPQADLYRLRGQAYETLGEFEHARSDYERAFNAARDAGDGRTQWQTVVDLGSLWAGRDYERAGSFFQEAVLLAQQLNDPVLHAHSLNRLGNWLVNTGRVAEGLEAHQQALEVFQAQQDREGLEGMAGTFDLLGMALAWTGDNVSGAQRFQRAIALFRQLGDKRSLISTLPNANLVACPAVNETALVVLRPPEECERDLAEAALLAREVDWPAGEAYALFTGGLLLAGFGQFGRALAHAQKGLQIALEIEHQQWTVGAYCALGQIYVLMLEPALALSHLDTGLPLAEQLGSAWWIGTLRAYKALAYLLQGHSKHAEATLQAAMPRNPGDLPVPRTLIERRVAWVWGELALAQGNAQLAQQIAELLIASAPGDLRTQPIPRLFKLKGEALIALKRPDEAVEALEEARRGALVRREAPLLWQIDRSLARVYRLLKREMEAAKSLAAAQEGIESLAQTIDEAEHTELREHFLQGARSSLPRVKPSALTRAAAEKLGGLTAREREVAVLIARGKTSREIAEVLVISERTGEGNVNNILGKLGFTSRAQIAAWAVEQDLSEG